MKKFFVTLVFSLCFILSACGAGDASDAPTMDADHPQEAVSEPVSSALNENAVSEPLYFSSDEMVEAFFVNYNALAEIPIPAEMIEKGNIQTKALAYMDGLRLEVIHADSFLSVSASSSAENETAVLYAFFRDSIRAARADASDDAIQSAWDGIHESGYLTEDYVCGDIRITYAPSKELSRGVSDARIDLEIPLTQE